MKIMIDLDGVVYNSENYVKAMAEIFDLEYCKGEGIKSKKNFSKYKNYNWTESQIKEFESLVYPEGGCLCNLMPCAKEVLDKLSAKHELIVVTKRGFFGQLEIDLSNKVILKDKLPFSKIYYNQTNKLQKCKELNIDVAIEDNFENVTELVQNNFICIYYREVDQPRIHNDKVIEVHNWGEILRAVNKIEGNYVS